MGVGLDRRGIVTWGWDWIGECGCHGKLGGVQELWAVYQVWVFLTAKRSSYKYLQNKLKKREAGRGSVVGIGRERGEIIRIFKGRGNWGEEEIGDRRGEGREEKWEKKKRKWRRIRWRKNRRKKGWGRKLKRDVSWGSKSTKKDRCESTPLWTQQQVQNEVFFCQQCQHLYRADCTSSCQITEFYTISQYSNFTKIR